MDLVLSQQLARGSPSQDTVEMGLAGWEAHEQARHSSGQKTEFEYSKLHLVSSFTPTPPPPPKQSIILVQVQMFEMMGVT